MLIIKFVIRGATITWFVNNNWIMVISFLLTMVSGIFYRRRKIKNSNKNIKIPNPKGGAFTIDECIEPDSIYELLDRPLEIVLKQMLNLPVQAGPVVISVPLLIISYIVSRQPVKQVTILGVKFFADKFKDLAIKTGFGILSGSIFFFNPVGVGIVSLTSGLLTGAIILDIVMETNNFECNSLVSKVTMERVSQEKTIGFLETRPERTPKVFIKGSEDIELYIPNHNDNGSCSSEYKQVEVKKSNIGLGKTETQIHRTCERKYVPLKERTKTLADLKKEDSTESREKAAPYIKRYEDRRRRITDKRVEL
jgi:hypothetical protein